MDLEQIGRLLLLVGALMSGVGLLFIFGSKVPLLGRLPGNISLRWGDTSFYFPVLTSLLLSLVVTVLINVIVRFVNRS